jgi:hypothetical protein
MAGFTSLELTVFSLIGEDHPAIAAPLANCIASAEVTERKNTGHGFYTSFESADPSSPLRHQGSPIEGPNLDVQARHAVLMMGFLLWVKGGHPNCLEGFQYGTRDGNRIDLHEADLAGLKSLGRLPPTLSVQ